MQTFGVSSSTDTTAATQKSRTDLGQKDIFLKLLVAQMKYQDPQKPQDPTQMASQLAQFNMVEQQTNTNALLNQLLASNGTGATASGGASLASASWLGHTVTVNQGQVHFDGATPQQLNLKLAGNAAVGFLNIMDANGNPVRTVSIAGMGMGENVLTWDGRMDNGAIAPAGDYTISASATDVSGQSIQSTLSHSGIVEAVRFNATGNELVVNGVAVSTADITEIRP